MSQSYSDDLLSNSSTTSRRRFLATASAVTATATAGTHAFPKTADNKKWNLLFVLTDQWRASAFGHSSDEVVRTPNIDRLGKQGVICNRAYAANPVCTPNRSCLLTGRHSHQTGMVTNNLMLPPEEVCWPQIFADAGYRTHYIGKWHVDGEAKPGFVPHGWRRRGFQTFEGFNRGHIYHKPWGFTDSGSPLIPEEVANDPEYYEPTYQTDLAIRFMKKNQNSPFACCVSLGPPHTPFKPPNDFNRYTTDEIQLRSNVPKQHERQARRDLAGYYGLCESLDHEVGRMMSFLDQSGLADSTLVVFTSDHGELAGSHGKYRKGEPEDESLRVPLIMRQPDRIRAGTTSEALVNSIDLMPTILNLCDLPDPGTTTGRNVSSTLTGDDDRSNVQSSIYCEGKLTGPAVAGGKKKPQQTIASANGAWRAVVTKTHKLVVRGGENSVAQLFDLANDPFEQKNLAQDTQHQALKAELLEELLAHRDATGDSWPNPPQPAKKMYDGPA